MYYDKLANTKWYYNILIQQRNVSPEIHLQNDEISNNKPVGLTSDNVLVYITIYLEMLMGFMTYSH